MRRIVTISYTGLSAGGGVPKFNRDLHDAFFDRECLHFSWEDFPAKERFTEGVPEWVAACLLNRHLIQNGLIGFDDIVVADGFWADGLENLPFAISHSHGIWSHLTYTDVLAGKQPDMPMHHLFQVNFRRRWTARKKKLTAVSAFISREMFLQWGFLTDKIINNGVDTDLWKPMQYRSSYRKNQRPLVIHGVNDRSNKNKGGDHIELLERELAADVMSFDAAVSMFKSFSDRPWERHEVLAQADLVVHPSGYEGNSMFIAEAMACGVPIVGYDVGYFAAGLPPTVAYVMPRVTRSPQTTLEGCRAVLSMTAMDRAAMGQSAREWAPSKKTFIEEWRSFVEKMEYDQDQGR